MKKSIRISLLAIGLFIANTSFAQLNWILKNASGTSSPVESNGKYLLVNKSNNYPLKYGKRSLTSRAAGCINIVWGSSTEALGSSNFVNVVRAPGASGPIKTGEKVALRFEGGGYLNQAHQTVGVNLEWVSSNTSSVPYIWEIRGVANKVNETLNTNVEFGIYCHKNEDWLAFCERSDPGINLGWTTSCSGCKRSGFDFARDYVPYSTKIIGDVKKRTLDGENLVKWCQ